MNKYLSPKYLTIFSAFLAIFFLFVKAPTDPDFFWHLRYGEEIFKAHGIPYLDNFSFTFSGYRWADSYWLSEVLIFTLVSKTGFLFPALIFAVFGAGIFLAVGLWGRVEKASLGAIAGAAFLGALVALPVLGLRPQTVSAVFTGIVFILLHQFWLKTRPKLMVFLPLIFLIWANSHAGFTLGLALIWVFWAGEMGRFLAEKIFKTAQRGGPFLSWSSLKILFGINLLSILATLVNPYGIGLWQAILNDASSVQIKTSIMEWAAPNSHSEAGLIFFFFTFLLVVLAYWRRLRINPTYLFVLSVFYLVALAAVRHVAVFALLVIPFLAEELNALSWGRIKFAEKNLVLPLFFLVFALVWAVEFFPGNYKSSRSVKDLALAGDYPYQAVEYLKAHPQERMFNFYNWGGFLTWELPENKTFVDGRMSGWRKDGRSILVDHDRLINLESGFEDVLNFWQIKSFFIPVNSSLAGYLKVSPNLEVVYEDQAAVIFASREAKKEK